MFRRFKVALPIARSFTNPKERSGCPIFFEIFNGANRLHI
jgi:hypothetical protein